MATVFQKNYAFSIIWLAYASTYLLRKPFGFMKEQIKSDFDLSETSLGYLDFAFLLPYAIGSLCFAGMVDKFEARRVLIGGLMGSALSTFLLFFANNYPLFLILVFLSGSFQSILWPAACSLISNWFPDTPRAMLFSSFGTSCFVGSLLGTLLPVLVELYFRDFRLIRSTYIIASAIVFFLAVIAMLSVKNPASSKDLKNSKEKSPFYCFSLPIVKEAALVMFFVKSVRYAFMFWLPYYMIESLGYTAIAAGATAFAFDVGAIIGTLFIGVVSMRLLNGNETLAALYSILCSIVFIVIFFTVQPGGDLGWTLNFLWLALIGAFNCGPDIVFTGSLAAKLGELHGCPSAVTGAINGMGSLGTVIEGPIIAFISHFFGINYISIFMGSFSLFALYFAHVANRKSEKQSYMLPL